jgi:uncharacterized protein YneF (UPF0154 family)
LTCISQGDLGKVVGKGHMKTAHTLKNYPDLLFLQRYANTGNNSYIEQLENEVKWVNKFREMGIKTPKYFKTLSMIDKDGQERHGILVERIHSAAVVKPEDLLGGVRERAGELLKDERTTHKTLADIQNLLKKFNQHPNLSISDLQMLMGRDGQLYVFDPINSDPPSSGTLSNFLQQVRKDNIEDLEKLRDKSLGTLKKFDQNKGMHAILISENVLKQDPEFEKDLLNKAKKQKDLVIMSCSSDSTIKVLYEPKTDYKIDRIEVILDENNRFISKNQMNDLIKENPKVSSDMVFRHTLKKDFSNYRTNIIVQHGNSDIAVKAAQDLATKHPKNSVIVHFDANNKLVDYRYSA